MIEPTDEMIEAFEKASGRAVGRNSLAGLVALLAIVERNYHVIPRGSEVRRCDCPPEKCYGSTLRNPGQACAAILARQDGGSK